MVLLNIDNQSQGFKFDNKKLLFLLYLLYSELVQIVFLVS